VNQIKLNYDNQISFKNILLNKLKISKNLFINKKTHSTLYQNKKKKLDDYLGILNKNISSDELVNKLRD